MNLKLQFKSLLAASLLVLGTTTFAQELKNHGVDGNPSFNGTPVVLSGSKPASNVQSDLLQLENQVTGSQKRAYKTIPGLPETVNPYIQTYDKNSRVLVDIAAKGDANALANELKAKGAEITGVYGRMISAIIPVAKISEFGDLPALQNMKPSYKPRTHAGKVTSQGDKAQRSDLARSLYGVDGLGVRVGVLSNSYNAQGGAAAGVASDDLPADVNILRDYLTTDSDDEGRAMMEIIHDVAPKATGAFASANYGQAAFANDIVRLATDAKCPVIVDDVYYFAEPFFSDGVIAQAVDYVKNVKGVSYFSAAGNDGRAAYDNSFNPSTAEILGPGNGTAHNFSRAGDAARYYQPIYIPKGGDFLVSFQWDEPFFSASGVGAKSDLDVYLVNSAGNIVAYSASDNIKSGDPVEVMYYANPTTSTSVTYYLVVLKYDGPNPGRLHYLNFGYSGFYNVLNPYLGGQFSSTIVGHSNAEGSISVAAARYDATPAFGVNPAVTESFSSEGGVPVLFDKSGKRMGWQQVRVQPSITAPQGANTTFFYPGDDYEGDGFPNFFGTSAAAPHAAAVAALMFDAARKKLTPFEVKLALQQTAQDMDDQWDPGFQYGWDFNSGYGLLRADLAVRAVKATIWWVNPLALKGGCANTDNTRKWIVENPNNFNIRASYIQKGGGETKGELLLTPGTNEIVLAYLPTTDGKNSLTLTWKDQDNNWKYAFNATGACAAARLAENESSQLQVVHAFPNPTVERFNIAVANAETGQFTVQVFNVQGKLVAKPRFEFSQNVVSMPVSDLASGMYFVKVTQGSQTQTVKMIKQ